jgi:RNA polymerase sigma-70 factor (ECF subfamily)
MHPLAPAYETIVGPIEDRMIRAVWRIVRNGHDAEDALQNALTTIWKRWSHVARHTAPQALVLKICAEAAYDVLRRRQRERQRTEAVASEPFDPRPGPTEVLARRETQAVVMTAIARLSKQQAVSFSLRVFDELPYSEIAAALGCGEATARKHVERARYHLGVALAPYESIRIARNRP